MFPGGHGFSRAVQVPSVYAALAAEGIDATVRNRLLKTSSSRCSFRVNRIHLRLVRTLFPPRLKPRQ